MLSKEAYVYLFFCKVCGKLDSVYFFAHNFYFYAEKYTLPAFSIRKVYTTAIYNLFQKIKIYITSHNERRSRLQPSLFLKAYVASCIE